MSNFTYEPLYQLGKDKTSYRLISKDHVSIEEHGGRKILKVSSEAIKLIIENSIKDVMHFLREDHLESLAKILADKESSDNDRYVATTLLENAIIRTGNSTQRISAEVERFRYQPLSCRTI